MERGFQEQWAEPGGGVVINLAGQLRLLLSAPNAARRSCGMTNTLERHEHEVIQGQGKRLLSPPEFYL